jgi:GNAT superfamily N-acetyltransferase
VHLAVEGDLAVLHELRDRLRRGPFERPDEHTFHPHVTLRRSFPPDLIPGALRALTGVLPDWEADRLHLLEHVQDDAGGPRWIVAEETCFGQPEVVGRGGVELLLRTVGSIEPSTAARVPHLVADERPHAGRLVVVAESTGEPGAALGVAAGSVGAGIAVLRWVHVDPHARRTGIARHVLARACTDAARRGARTVVVDPAVPAPDPTVAESALASCGFTPIDALWLRRCGPAASN